MKKIVLLCLAALAASAVILFELGRTNAEFAADGAAMAAPSVNPAALALRRKIAAMTTEEKIGQMMMVSIPDATLSDATAAWLRSHHIGGIILLGKNIRSETQARQLITDVQKKTRDPTDPLLFIAADQEGGIVSRFSFLSEMTVQHDILNDAQAFEIGKKRGAELKAMGVNANFSPVLDVAESARDFIASRAFRWDSAKVTSFGAAMIRGYYEAGIIAVAKHFPGHGGTGVDSHKNLPTISRNAPAAASALLPFREAVKENVPMVMTGHIKVPEIDREYPASLSPAAIRILRSDLGFNGVIITDDLGMGAIIKRYTLSDAAVQSIKAGADMVLVVRNFRDYDIIYEAIKSAVGRGDISEARLNQSIARILSLKERYME